MSQVLMQFHKVLFLMFIQQSKLGTMQGHWKRCPAFADNIASSGMHSYWKIVTSGCADSWRWLASISGLIRLFFRDYRRCRFMLR